MKKILCLVIVLTLSMVFTFAFAGTWKVPNNHNAEHTDTDEAPIYSISAKLIDDLATRSGPSTTYTGCGSYKMKGQYVTVLTRSYDTGGVLWVEIEFSYGGGYRRAWTGAKRLELNASQLNKLPEEDLTSYIGYGTVNLATTPRFGPGSIFSTYSDRSFRRGDRVAVISTENDFFMVECYHTDGNVFRSWIPCSNVNLD